MGQTRQRVVLVHELAELAGAEELLDGGDHRADVDQRLRRDRLDVLSRHPFTDHALHPGQANADLVLDEFADRPDPAVGEVVLVVDPVVRLAIGHVLGQVKHVGRRRQDLGGAEHSLGGRGPLEVDGEDVGDPLDLRPELPVQLVPTDPGQVIALRVEEGVLEVLTGRLDREGLAGTGTLVDFEQGLFTGGSEVLLFLPLALEEVEVADEPLQECLILVSEGTEQHEERQAALAGDATSCGDVLARLGLDVELDPLTTVRMDGAGEDCLGITARLEDDSRGAHQLADDHSLGAVDDEGALVGHDGEVPHEDRLLLDLTGSGVHEPGAHEDRRGIGHVLLLALLHRVLRRRAQVGVGRVELELEAQRSREVLDRADVVERLCQATVEEPLEGVPLNGDEVRQRKRLVDVGKRKTFRAVGPCRQRPTPPSCKANGARTGYCGETTCEAARLRKV